MTFEVGNRPFRLRAHGVSRLVHPGELIELDEQHGRRLLEKAPGLVRVLSSIRWCSPLFGNLEGHVLLTDGDTILVNHPIIGEPAWIRRSWIVAKGVNHAS